MSRDARRPRLFAERWPVVFVAPVFYLGGYEWWQVIAFTIGAVVLAEVAFAIVRVLLLDREWRR